MIIFKCKICGSPSYSSSTYCSMKCAEKKFKSISLLPNCKKDLNMNKVVNEVEVKRIEWQYGEHTFETIDEAYRNALLDCFEESHSLEDAVSEMINNISTAKAVYYVLGEMVGK